MKKDKDYWEKREKAGVNLFRSGFGFLCGVGAGSLADSSIEVYLAIGLGAVIAIGGVIFKSISEKNIKKLEG